MKIGYARVSRFDQNLDLQTDALNAAGVEQIFTDKVSGGKNVRTGLKQMFEVARSGDQIIVWRLDRLGRSLKDLIEIAAKLADRNIELVSLNESIDTTTPNGRLFFHIFGAMAEWERAWIIERTTAGLDSARARGIYGGRPPALDADGVRTAEQMLSDGKEVADVARLLKCSERTIRRVLSGKHRYSQQPTG